MNWKRFAAAVVVGAIAATAALFVGWLGFQLVKWMNSQGWDGFMIVFGSLYFVVVTSLVYTMLGPIFTKRGRSNHKNNLCEIVGRTNQKKS